MFVGSVSVLPLRLTDGPRSHQCATSSPVRPVGGLRLGAVRPTAAADLLPGVEGEGQSVLRTVMRTREVFFPPSREDARSTMMPPPAGVGVLACRGSSHLHEDTPGPGPGERSRNLCQDSAANFKRICAIGSFSRVCVDGPGRLHLLLYRRALSSLSGATGRCRGDR